MDGELRTFDEADMAAYLEVREVLEKKALALARPHLVEADLRCMLDGNTSSASEPRIDNSLHGYLVESWGMPTSASFSTSMVHITHRC